MVIRYLKRNWAWLVLCDTGPGPPTLRPASLARLITRVPASSAALLGAVSLGFAVPPVTPHLTQCTTRPPPRRSHHQTKTTAEDPLLASLALGSHQRGTLQLVDGPMCSKHCYIAKDKEAAYNLYLNQQAMFD